VVSRKEQRAIKLTLEQILTQAREDTLKHNKMVVSLGMEHKVISTVSVPTRLIESYINKLGIKA